MENEAVIDRVCIHFVFMGDPAEAERSQVLDKLREDLENKKYLIDQRFGRPITMVIEFRSARTRKVGSTTHLRKTHSYPVALADTVTRSGPDGEIMTIGFMRLVDLHEMYRDMGVRFFERNIRAALPEGEAVNRSIQQSIKRIVLDGTESSQAFAFNHNGVTLFAEALNPVDGQFKVTEPRQVIARSAHRAEYRCVFDNLSIAPGAICAKLRSMTPTQILAHLRAANDVAREAAAHGHHPFGAVLVRPDDRVLMRQA